MFRTVPPSIIRSFSMYTQQWCRSYRFAHSLRAGSGRNCLKHVEFYSKNKFEKLVHLVGFIIRIYHDARSPECQNNKHLRMNSKNSFYLQHEVCNSVKDKYSNLDKPPEWRNTDNGYRTHKMQNYYPKILECGVLYNNHSCCKS